MIISADTPRVAMYENGVVIFRKVVNKRGVYHRVVLDDKAMEPFRSRVRAVLALKKLKPYLDMALRVSYMPEAKFYLRDGSREVVIDVYGLMANGTELPSFTVAANRDKSDAVPPQLLELHKVFWAFDDTRSVQWTPPIIEVMFWEYSYAPDPSMKWPDKWPSLTSERSKKRGDDYFIFFDRKTLSNLQGFLATKK